jgi:hypothetical protein
MWSALALIFFREIWDRLGRVQPGIVGMNDELVATCLESGIENAPQTNIGIELLALWKHEHDVEIHYTEPYCDLSVPRMCFGLTADSSSDLSHP